MNILDKIDTFLKVDENKHIVYDCRVCDKKNKCKVKKSSGRPDNCPLKKEAQILSVKRYGFTG